MSSTKRKPLFTESTEVDSAKSIGEIQGLFLQAGARGIHYEYDDSGKMTGMSFTLPYGHGQISYKLPARIEPVFENLQNRRQTEMLRRDERDLKPEYLDTLRMLEVDILTRVDLEAEARNRLRHLLGQSQGDE